MFHWPLYCLLEPQLDILHSDSITAEISDTSPWKLFIYIVNSNVFRIQVSYFDNEALVRKTTRRVSESTNSYKMVTECFDPNGISLYDKVFLYSKLHKMLLR